MFCTYLREALKTQLQRGQMKAMKSFVKTCYSEELLSAGAGTTAEIEQEKAGPDPSTSPPANEKSTGDGPTFHGGLGLKFKFPGDPKK